MSQKSPKEELKDYLIERELESSEHINLENIEYLKAQIEENGQKLLENNLTQTAFCKIRLKIYTYFLKLDDTAGFDEFKKIRNRILSGKLYIDGMRQLKKDIEGNSDQGLSYLIIQETIDKVLKNYDAEKNDSFLEKFKNKYYDTVKEYVNKTVEDYYGKEENAFKLYDIRKALKLIIDTKYATDREKKSALKREVDQITAVRTEKAVLIPENRIKELLVKNILDLKDEKEIEKVWDTFYKNFWGRKYIISNEQSDDSGSNYFVSDIEEVVESNQLERQIEEENLINLAEKIYAYLDVESNSNLRKYMKALITTAIVKHELYWRDKPDDLQEYVDKDFEKYYLNIVKDKEISDLNQLNFDDIFSKYIGNKYDTVRKYSNKIKLKVQNFKLEILSKSNRL